MRKLWVGLLSCLPVMLVVGACGGGNEGTPVPPTRGATATSRPAATTPATSAPTARPTVAPPTPTTVPVSSGELRSTSASLGTGLNPGLPTPGDKPFIDLMFSPLIGTDPEGGLDPQAGFVISWTANADSSVWTFKVRDNLLFHDGIKGTAKDVAFALEVGLNPNSGFSQGGQLRASVAKLETPDNATLIVSLKAPDIFWNRNYFSPNIPVHSFPKYAYPKHHIDAVGHTEANKKMVGSGPYKFKSEIAGDRVITEAVDRHFYFGVPRTKTVTMMAIPDETARIALLKTGAADIAPILAANVAQVTQAGLTVKANAGSSFFTIWNGQYPDNIPGYGPNPLASVKVRKALFWHAIDRKTIVDKFLNGRGRPSMDYPIGSWDLAKYTPLPVPPYDPPKSRALLAEAGYPKGFELDTYLISDGVQLNLDIMEAIAVYWENIGVKVNRLPIDRGGFTRALIAALKPGFSKPTLGGNGGGGNREISPAFALLQHDPDTIYSVSRDPEGLRLAKEYSTAKSIEEYIKKGDAYRQYAYENAATFGLVFETDALWAHTNRVPPSWQLFKGSGGFRLSYAAAR